MKREKIKKAVIIISIPIIIYVIYLLVIGIELLFTYPRPNITENLVEVICHQLHAGMTLEEVREVLNNYGEYKEGKRNYPGFTRIIISYVDPEVRESFGDHDIYLRFEKYELIDGTVPFGEGTIDVCGKD